MYKAMATQRSNHAARHASLAGANRPSAGWSSSAPRRLVRLLAWLAVSLAMLLALPMPAQAQGVRTGDGAWIWQNPLPQGNTLSAVWGSDANNVWAVGARALSCSGDIREALAAQSQNANSSRSHIDNR